MSKPKIRFNGFTEDWEQRKVKEFIDEGIIEVPMDGNHGEKHPTASEYVNNGIPFLMASDIHNGEVDINYCKYITRERAEKLDKGFAKNGDVLITHKATIGETAILQGLEEEYAVLTPQVTYYRIRDEKQLNRKYLYAFFNSEDFQNDLKKKAAQSTRPYIGISAQQNLMISLPQNRKEQKQIGEYFFSLGHLITLHQRKCEQTKKLKKFMLQKMFPQNGNAVPEIRFEGFTEAWEQRKFDSIVQKYEDPVETPTDGYMRLGIRSHAKGTFHSYVEKGKELETAKMFRVAANNFIVNITFGWEHAVAITDDKDAGKLVSHRFPQYSFHAGMNPKFFRYLILDEKFKHHLKLSSPGGAGRNRVLKLSDMLDYKMYVPKQEEQSKIAAYFERLDYLITLHQHKCDELVKIKKYMLQNMFV